MVLGTGSAVSDSVCSSEYVIISIKYFNSNFFHNISINLKNIQFTTGFLTTFKNSFFQTNIDFPLRFTRCRPT